MGHSREFEAWREWRRDPFCEAQERRLARQAREDRVGDRMARSFAALRGFVPGFAEMVRRFEGQHLVARRRRFGR